MVLAHDTSSCHDDHLCQIIYKFHHAGRNYEPDTILECTNEQTHTQTGKTICPSVISWQGGGHKNITISLSLLSLSLSLSLSLCPCVCIQSYVVTTGYGIGCYQNAPILVCTGCPVLMCTFFYSILAFMSHRK